jgi:hypothetical protein
VTSLLLAFTSKAQSHYDFYKPMDTINAILYKNKNIFYVENGDIIKNIKKVQANQYGKIRIIDTIYTEIDSSEIKTPTYKEAFIDLFKFDTIIVSGSQINFKDKNNKTYRTIYGFDNLDILIFKRQIETLKHSCQKIRVINSIKEYYSNLKTGYDTPGGFIKVTDNYKVNILNSVLTVSFDTFMYKEFQKTETVTFDLSEIISVYYKGTVYQEFENGFVLYAVASSIGFKSNKTDYSLHVELNREIQYEDSQIFKTFQELIKLYNNK